MAHGLIAIRNTEACLNMLQYNAPILTTDARYCLHVLSMFRHLSCCRAIARPGFRGAFLCYGAPGKDVVQGVKADHARTLLTLYRTRGLNRNSESLNPKTQTLSPYLNLEAIQAFAGASQPSFAFLCHWGHEISGNERRPCRGPLCA